MTEQPPAAVSRPRLTRRPPEHGGALDDGRAPDDGAAPHDSQAGDSALAVRAGAGDHTAFVTLMTKYRPLIHGTCLRIVGDLDDACDAEQETLLRAWRGLAGFRSDALFSTWLYRIAVNAALSEVERRGRRPLPAGWDLPDRAAQTRPVSDQVADRISVRHALELLPPPYRAVVVLRDCCGCGYREIAEITGIPVNTVKSRISRARQALVKLLGTDGKDSEGL